LPGHFHARLAQVHAAAHFDKGLPTQPDSSDWTCMQTSGWVRGLDYALREQLKEFVTTSNTRTWLSVTFMNRPSIGCADEPNPTASPQWKTPMSHSVGATDGQTHA